jgi:hypothetical protein
MGSYREQRVGAAVALGVGSVLFLIARLDPRDGNFPSGRGAVAYVAACFFLAGVCLLLPTLPLGRWQTRAQSAAGVMLVSMMLGFPIILVFFPGAFKRAPPPPVFPSVAVSTERVQVEPGELVHVLFDRPVTMPPDYTAVVAIVPDGAPVQDSGSWAYLEPAATDVHVQAPSTPGLYEVRLKPHLNAVLATAPLRVGARDGSAVVEREP